MSTSSNPIRGTIGSDDDQPPDQCDSGATSTCALSPEKDGFAGRARGAEWVERALNAAGRWLARLHGYVVLRADVKWLAPLPPGPKIFVANHPTTTDGFLAMALPGVCHLMVEEMAFDVPFIGWYLRGAGHLLVERDRPWICYRRACEYLRRGHNVVIAPEGGLSPADGSTGKTYTGFARLAMASGAPVVPLGIAVQRERIWVVETTVKGVTKTARHYPLGRYCLTGGAPIRFDRSGQWREQLRLAPARLMEQVQELASESARRLAT